MNPSSLEIKHTQNKLSLVFQGELTLYNLTKYQKKIDSMNILNEKSVLVDFNNLTFIDSAGAIFINKLQKLLSLKHIKTNILCDNEEILDMLNLVKNAKYKAINTKSLKRRKDIEKLGKKSYDTYVSILSFLAFMGEVFLNKTRYLLYPKSIRFKEIFFEINESGVKALGIVMITSFLIGVVISYQSAYQLKIYGANIFIVDMLGLSILRELAPIITAIVIAGRSGSAFTAQIGAMKITQELDAMRTMGFDPYRFLVLPRIIALMITLPILIFIADIMALIGGMIVANIDLGITVALFIDRFNEVIAVKHFFIGIAKGPFFAFLIAIIGVYRGMKVKNDTQSIGFSTTKSVVESIFAVIICDAVFSIAFTSLGI
jgi:phospholipid/cholesterol/gamma-HCH transport system permease protein